MGVLAPWLVMVIRVQRGVCISIDSDEALKISPRRSRRHGEDLRSAESPGSSLPQLIELSTKEQLTVSLNVAQLRSGTNPIA